MRFLHKTQLATAIALGGSILLASGCGRSSPGGGGDGAGGSDIVSRGQITGFGSIYVNGKRFGTGSARFEIDDDDGKESELRLGMVVTVMGGTDGRGNWHANRVVYDNELKGPVSSIVIDPADPTRKVAVVLGQNVILDAGTRFDDDGGLGFDSIAVGDVVEVSGFIAPAGLVATHVELQDSDDEIELKGLIENLAGGSFSIRGFPVTFDGSTQLERIGSLEDGLLVEVEGRLDAAGTTLIAEKIEAEDDRFDDDDFEVEGMIMDFDAASMTFTVQGTPVDASSATLFPASLILADGLTVEAEGHFVGGVLLADKVKQRGNKIKIDAPLSAVGPASVSFSFGGTEVVVQVNRGTELEDDTGNPVAGLFDFTAGDFVELEAFEDSSGSYNALEIERTDAGEIEIEAPVDAFDAGLKTVDLLGVEFDLTAARFEDDSDRDINAAEFFSLLVTGRFVELEDRDRNGVIDKAELDD